jgi:hypothetical protein
MDPRAGVDEMEKRKFLTLPELVLQPLGRPASRYPEVLGSNLGWDTSYPD